MKIASFTPLVNDDAEILILGTMPGAISLQQQEYYAHRQNAFWKIMFNLLGELPVPEKFSERIALLQQNRIALWDVLAQCERKGSLDSNIRNQHENDIPGLLLQYPNIKTILFNGKVSYKYFVKKFGKLENIRLEVMPSTSPAYTLKFEEKLKNWKVGIEQRNRNKDF